MKTKLITISMLLAAAMLGCHKEPAGAGDHKHPDENAAAAKVSKPAQRFATDENLRVRMTTILKTMKAMHDSGAKVNLAETGAKIEATVQDIFKKCKLVPAADAAIHPILAELLKGADLFKKSKEKEGHEIIHNALMRYEDFFDHPGWSHPK
jgi:hypothetical protein